jgi:hypothetical protein
MMISNTIYILFAGNGVRQRQQQTIQHPAIPKGGILIFHQKGR